MKHNMKEMTDAFATKVLTEQTVNFMMNWLGTLAHEDAKMKKNIKDLTIRLEHLEEKEC